MGFIAKYGSLCVDGNLAIYTSTSVLSLVLGWEEALWGKYEMLGTGF